MTTAVEAGESSASGGRAENAQDAVFPLGAIVECSTVRGERMRGEVLCYDSSTRMLVIRHESNIGVGKSEMRFINLALVEHVTVLQYPPNDHVPSFPYSNTAQAQERLRRAEQKKKRELLQTNVSLDGQRVFVAIRKTLEETRWDADRIVVFEHAMVVPPYDVGCVRPYPEGSTPSQVALDTIAHVGKIIGKHQSKCDATTTSGHKSMNAAAAKHQCDTDEAYDNEDDAADDDSAEGEAQN
jgi:hypothetical protein